MISRSRSGPNDAAMSIECTTSANSTVTCLYSADRVACVSRVPHSPQNLAVGLDCAPQEPQNNLVAVNPPPPSPLGSTSVSCHRWSTTGRPTTGLRRNSKLRLVSFKDWIGPLQFTVIPSKECHTKPTTAQQTATDFRASRMSYSRHDYLGGWPTAACVRGSLQPGVKDFFAQLIAETTPRAPTPGRIMNGDRQADPSPRQAAQSQADRVTR